MGVRFSPKATAQWIGSVVQALRQEQFSRLKRIGCVSHARRKFYQALRESCSEALGFIGQVRQLYQWERELKDASPAARRQGRLQTAPAIWLGLKRRAEAIRAAPRVLPQSTSGKAARYWVNAYTARVGYLRDGRFEIDSNLVGNELRPSAVGKRRWLCIGQPEAGWRSAVIYTRIPSCRRYGINPQEYLTEVLGRLPAMIHSQVGELLPHRWRQARRGGGAGVPLPAPPDDPAFPGPVSRTTLTPFSWVHGGCFGPSGRGNWV